MFYFVNKLSKKIVNHFIQNKQQKIDLPMKNFKIKIKNYCSYKEL